jgi:hypothetical protein
MAQVFKPFASPGFRVLAALVAALVILAMITDRLITVSEDKDFHARFEGIEIGMPESLVLSLLGSPDDHSSEFYLGQKEGFEEAYMRAAASGAINYVMWHRGIDLVYAIGFNKEGNAAVVESGGT